MRITELLDKRSVDLNAAPKSKKEAMDMAVELMAASGKVQDKEAYRALVYAREEESTTGVGEGIAIPHGKGDCIDKPGLAAMIIKDGVDYEALDDEPVNILFLIAAPDTKDNVHLDVMSKLSMMLMDEDFRNNLINAKDVDEFLAVIDKADEEKKSVDEGLADVVIEEGSKYLVAVTSCPTGIAHTYMAAEGLEKAASKAGIPIKIETRGSSGAKNQLTADDIKDAFCVIVTADAKVPMERFAGKKVIQRKVADGINKADELIALALAGDAPVYAGGGEEEAESKSSEKGGAGHKIYTWLMSGVSHMLPFVIGGGILVALAFLVDTIAGYGATGGGDFGSITPLAAFLKYVGGLAMGLMVPVLAGYIAYAIADRPGLAVGFVGGIIAASGNAILANYTFAEGVLLDGKAVGGFGQFLMKFAFQNGGNTVSGFLGGIVAGFLAGFIVLGLQKIGNKLPSALDGLKPTLIYPLFGILIEGILMCFIFNPVIGLVNTGLEKALTSLGDANMVWLLGLILAGGMVPPIGIALACLIFPKKFTKAERGSTVSNFVMGASFITEGAIPFAAADPLHVIPCTMVGAGVAGLLTALFKCELMAPHGGVFVFATVKHPLLYILAWIAGSIVTCLMLGVLKKKAED